MDTSDKWDALDFSEHITDILTNLVEAVVTAVSGETDEARDTAKMVIAQHITHIVSDVANVAAVLERVIARNSEIEVETVKNRNSGEGFNWVSYSPN